MLQDEAVEAGPVDSRLAQFRFLAHKRSQLGPVALEELHPDKVDEARIPH